MGKRVLGLLTALALSPALFIAPSAARADQGVSLASGYTDFTLWNHYGSSSAVNTTPGNGFTYSEIVLTQRNVGSQAGAAFAPRIAAQFNSA